MHTRPIIFTLIFVGIMLLLDFYCYKGIKTITNDWQKLTLKRWAHIIYWFFAIGLYVALILSALNISAAREASNYKYFYYVFGVFILFFLPKLVFAVFHLIDDIGNGIAAFIQKSSSATTTDYSRRKFITQTGAVLAAIPFISIGYGMLKGRYDFRVLKEKLTFKNLPKSFDGIKIVQFSDMHIGSFFNNYKAVERAIEMINELKPDLILFTGDFVNNYASELDGWESIFSKLDASIGKYSILGNHDYGDYAQWSSEEEKAKNLSTLIATQQKMGFNVLLNDSAKIERGEDSINLLGMENWGLGGFSKYGNLPKTMEKVGEKDFKILLSHDPSHWDAEVLGKTNIDLALAGHTHGMQFGVEIAGIKWSPVKWRYPRWAGLYQEKDQYLYINRGLGYIGFPGRVGIWPEITFLELYSAT